MRLKLVSYITTNIVLSKKWKTKKGNDQAVRMSKLICAFDGWICHKAALAWCSSYDTDKILHVFCHRLDIKKYLQHHHSFCSSLNHLYATDNKENKSYHAFVLILISFASVQNKNILGRLYAKCPHRFYNILRSPFGNQKAHRIRLCLDTMKEIQIFLRDSYSQAKRTLLQVRVQNKTSSTYNWICGEKKPFFNFLKPNASGSLANFIGKK